MAIEFRNKALLKQQSPEQIDEPMRIIWQKKRLAFYTITFIIVTGLAWGIWGRLPHNGQGKGILVTPNSVVPVQSQADGQIGQWLTHVGAVVKKGEVLGILEQPELKRQLDQAKAQFEETIKRNQAIKVLRDRYAQLSREANERQRRMLQDRIDYLAGYIQDTNEFAARINDQEKKLLSVETSKVSAESQMASELVNSLKQRVSSYERLRAENLTSEERLRSVHLQYDNSRRRNRELAYQAQLMELREVQTAQTFLDARNLVATQEYTMTQLELQLQELESQQLQLDKEDREATIREQNEIDALQRTIGRHQQQLEQDREIKSDHNGRILELTAAEGAFVNIGQRLVQIDARRDTDELVALAYFEDKVGKHLVVGGRARVAPLTVDRKRWGSIRGEVISVSEYPVTAESVVNLIGNQEVAARLLQGGFQIEARVRMQRDASTPSGYAWTSQQGPEIEITSGTTAEVWITYEHRPPITFVLPKLREWSGLPLALKLSWLYSAKGVE